MGDSDVCVVDIGEAAMYLAYAGVDIAACVGDC